MGSPAQSTRAGNRCPHNIQLGKAVRFFSHFSFFSLIFSFCLFSFFLFSFHYLFLLVFVFSIVLLCLVYFCQQPYNSLHNRVEVEPHNQPAWGSIPLTNRPKQSKQNYNRRAQITHTSDVPRAASSGDQGDCATGSQWHLLHQATPWRVGGIQNRDSQNGKKRNRPQMKEREESPEKELDEMEVSKLWDI